MEQYRRTGEGRATVETNPLSIGFLPAWDEACARTPDRIAFAQLGMAAGRRDTISFATMDGEANGLAARLVDAGHAPVLLWLFDDYHLALAMIACFKAGCVAVPLPRNSRRGHDTVAGIHRSLGRCTVLHGAGKRDAAELAFPASTLIELRREETSPSVPGRRVGSDIAYLQFTSGSTRQPRGVRITHANLAANIHAIASRFSVSTDEVYCHWLPLYHDMGLVTTLTALARGCTTHHMSPEHFARRPMDWLRAVSDTRATFTGAPNFALERCAARRSAEPEEIDLSNLRTLFCGAEPVQAETLHRFCRVFADAGLSAAALAPCYGLAEATLMVSGGRYDPVADREAVPCGHAVEGMDIRIVDPHTNLPVEDGNQGEIWVSGSSVGDGYAVGALDDDWFEARLAGDSRAFLRTGDLGRLVAGRLYVQGRLRDMVVVDGRNIHLCDVDATLIAAHPIAAQRPGAAVALERERLGIVQEARCGAEEAAATVQAIAAAVAREHGVAPSQIRLVRPGTIALTSSGKVRREACAALFAEGHPATIHPLRSQRGTREVSAPLTANERLVASLLGDALGCDEVIEPDRPFVDLGLSSSRAAELVHRLSAHTGVPLDTSVLYDHGSIIDLAGYVGARQRPGHTETDAAAIEPSGYRSEARAPLAGAMAAVALDATYVRACGDYLYDSDGHAVLDLVGGFGTTLFGHNPSPLIDVLRTSLDEQRVIHAQGSVRQEAGRLAAALSRRLQAAIGRRYAVSLWSTGAEAVEAAIRHARLAYDARARAWLVEADRRAALWSREHGETPVPDDVRALIAMHRQDVLPINARCRDVVSVLAEINRHQLGAAARMISFERAFHGKTSGARSLTQNRDHALFGSADNRVDQVPVDDAEALAAAIARQNVPLLRFDRDGRLQPADWCALSAVVIEPVQAEGGVHPLEPEDAARIRRATLAVGVPLIADEIQCGFGRCGGFTVSETIGLDPDYVLLGKALGGGVAKLAALAAMRTPDDHRFAMTHSSTFADDDVSALVGLAALDLFDATSVAERAARIGEAFRAAMERVRLDYPGAIRAVRGRGCLFGIELCASPETMAWAGDDLGTIAAGYLLQRHAIRLLPTLSAPNVLRLEPSAFLESADIARIAAAFGDLAATIVDAESPELVRHLCGGVARDPIAVESRAPRIREAAANVGIDAGTDADVPRVAFLSYLIERQDLARLDPRFSKLDPAEAGALLDRVHRHLPPRVVRRHRIRSTRGAAVDLLTIGLTVTSDLIENAVRRGDTEWLRAKVRDGIALALAEGCRAAGLGGYLSILTDNALDALSPELALTTGNSLTAAALIAGVEAAAIRCGLDLSTARVAIVGAGGNIGSFAAERLAGRVGRLDLIGRFGGSLRLATLADHLSAGGGMVVQAEMDALRDAQVVISTTSAPHPVIYAELLGPAARIVCDVAVPGDVDPLLAVARPDLTIFHGGSFAVPGCATEDFTLGNLAPGHAFACMSETILLGLDGVDTQGSIGAIRPDDAARLMARALHHGFTLSTGA